MWVILVVGRCLRKKMIAMRRTPPRLANYLKTCASSILYSSLACNNETERERESDSLWKMESALLCALPVYKTPSTCPNSETPWTGRFCYVDFFGSINKFD